MVAVFDCCSILNLIRLFQDESYLTRFFKCFDKCVITPKVFEEIKTNRTDISDYYERRDFFETLIFSYLRNYVEFSKIDDEIEWVRNKFNYKTDNGELHSSSHALYLSRYEGSEVSEKLLKVCFITDDAPASEEFSSLFNSNFVGKIIDTVDLLIILCLKGKIQFNSLISYCKQFKLLYASELSMIIKLLEKLRPIEKSIQDQRIHQKISRLINHLYDFDGDHNDEILAILQELNGTIYSDVKKKISVVLSQNYRLKIGYIQDRIDKIREGNIYN